MFKKLCQNSALALIAATATAANAQDFTNGILHNVGDPGAARITTTGGTTLYVGSTTNSLIDCNPSISGMGKINAHMAVYISSSLAHLFNSTPISVPISVRVDPNGQCDHVVAPYFFQDNWSPDGKVRLYMYYVNVIPDNGQDTGKVTRAVVAPIDTIRSPGAWSPTTVAWGSGQVNGYAFSITHASAQNGPDIDKSSYWGFYTTNGGAIHAFSLAQPDGAIGVDNEIATSASSGPDYFSFENWCVKDSGAMEGPQPFFSPNGSNLFVSYSADSYQTDFYSMGLLQFKPGAQAAKPYKLTDPANWTNLGHWFGTSANLNPDNLPDSDLCNPIASGAAAGKYGKLNVPNANGNYVVSTGSNAMVYDTGGTLWNLYGARFHSSVTNNRTLRMEPVAWSGQVPVLDQAPVPEGLPLKAALPPGASDSASVTFTGNDTFKWFESPSHGLAYRYLQDDQGSTCKKDGSNCGSGNSLDGTGSRSHQPGIYFSWPQTGTTTGAYGTPAKPQFFSGIPQSVLWMLDTDKFGSYTWTYGQYQYFVISFSGKTIHLYGPAASHGTATVFLDGVMDSNPASLANPPDTFLHLTTNMARLDPSGTTGEYYNHTFASGGFHTVMVMLNAQGYPAKGLNSNDPSSDQPDAPGSGSQKQNSSLQQFDPTANNQPVVLGLTSLSISQ